MAHINPFIRWAGGKSWLAKKIQFILGDTKFNRYHEPFLGGAAIFLSLDIKRRAYLSDINKELVDTYKAIRSNPHEVIQAFQSLEVSEEQYYKIRNIIPDNEVEKAARFIYLNQTSYNGLYRVNKNGKYNVPYGFRERMKYDANRILLASKKLSNANIAHGDFTINKKNIRQGDLVFLDPPYTVSPNNNGFVEYDQKFFSLDDQHRLSEFIDFIKQRMGYYILTNAANSKIEEIFDKNDRMIEFERYSLIGGKNAERKLISEFVFTNIAGGNPHD